MSSVRAGNRAVLVLAGKQRETGKDQTGYHADHRRTFADGKMVIQGTRARMELDVLFPEPIVAEEREGLMPENPEQVLPYLALRAPEARMDAKFLGVIRAARTLPDLRTETRSGDKWIGARIEGRWSSARPVPRCASSPASSRSRKAQHPFRLCWFMLPDPDDQTIWDSVRTSSQRRSMVDACLI